jgi:hypothetical protein
MSTTFRSAARKLASAAVTLGLVGAGLAVSGAGIQAAAATQVSPWALAGASVATVTSISPSSSSLGPYLGGTVVTISGSGFSPASQVTFGGAPATFSVDSDTQITATSPGGQGTVDVVVTTPAGPSTPAAGDQFAYPFGCTAGTAAFASQPIDVTEGQAFTQVIAHFCTTDANLQASQFTAQITWGGAGVTSTSGGTVVANPDGSFNVIGSHTYAEEGCCEEVNAADVTVTDQVTGLNIAGDSGILPDIADAPLTATGVPVSITAGTPFHGTVATFTDADPGAATIANYTATIDWGDGSPPDQGTISASGSGFAITGSHTYASGGPFTGTVQISDDGGATTSGTFRIASDRDLALSQPGDITVLATSNSGAVVSYPLPSVTDDDSSTVAPACSPAPGSTFPPGTTTVTCSASDADDSNGLVTTSFTVTVSDHDLALSQPASITATATSAAGAVVSYYPPLATDEGGDLVPATCSPVPGSVFPVGVTTVTCTPSDSDDTNGPLTTSFTVTVTIGCTSTITGTHTGPLAVGLGEIICVDGATVTGPVGVSAKGVLVVTNSHIEGPLNAVGTAGLTVCGSRIDGPVRVSGAAGPVLIGAAGDDGPPGCGANTITGAVVLSLSGGGIELGGNTISGPVTLVGNQPASLANADNAAPELEANHIGGPLYCSGNASVPADDQQPNTVTGPASGQCAVGLTAP